VARCDAVSQARWFSAPVGMVALCGLWCGSASTSEVTVPRYSIAPSVSWLISARRSSLADTRQGWQVSPAPRFANYLVAVTFGFSAGGVAAGAATSLTVTP